MVTFWLAFIWGLGISFGAAIGLLVFVVANHGLDWLTGKVDRYTTALQYNNRSLEQLIRRNDLTLETIVALERIAESMEEHTD